MQLLDWMKSKNMTDEMLASLVGSGVSWRAVKKWKYRETTPRVADLVRIEEITKGQVTARDFAEAKDGVFV
jgi:hypothetical protein